MCPLLSFFFFFNDTATTEIYTLSLHDALPISLHPPAGGPLCAPAHGGGARAGVAAVQAAKTALAAAGRRPRGTTGERLDPTIGHAHGGGGVCRSKVGTGGHEPGQQRRARNPGISQEPLPRSPNR